jgi:ABC-type transport system involved in cytochrome bd biosynthesis fused ATPase/permease subunit
MYLDAARFLVSVNGAPAELQADLEQALGTAIIHVLDLSYPQARWLAIVHAGAVAATRRALLLPGVSGSGKSTLTAALVGAGLRYLSDDIAPLDACTGSILPVPFALSVRRAAGPC